jgi:hypothetical protein
MHLICRADRRGDFGGRRVDPALGHAPSTCRGALHRRWVSSDVVSPSRGSSLLGGGGYRSDRRCQRRDRRWSWALTVRGCRCRVRGPRAAPSGLAPRRFAAVAVGVQLVGVVVRGCPTRWPLHQMKIGQKVREPRAFHFAVTFATNAWGADQSEVRGSIGKPLRVRATPRLTTLHTRRIRQGGRGWTIRPTFLHEAADHGELASE